MLVVNFVSFNCKFLKNINQQKLEEIHRCSWDKQISECSWLRVKGQDGNTKQITWWKYFIWYSKEKEGNHYRKTKLEKVGKGLKIEKLKKHVNGCKSDKENKS